MITTKFSSFLTSRIASDAHSSSGGALASLTFMTPTSFAFSVELDELPDFQPNDLIVGEFTVQNLSRSLNFVIQTLPAASTGSVTAFAPNPVTSSINGTEITAGAILLRTGVGPITFSSQKTLTLANQPILPTFPGAQRSGVTIVFKLFVNGVMVLVRNFNAQITVTWQTAAGQSVNGSLTFAFPDVFSGAFTLDVTSSFGTGPLTGTITGKGPGFAIEMAIDADVVVGGRITGRLLPDSSHLNSVYIPLVAFVTGHLTNRLMSLQLVLGQVLNCFAIPMLSKHFAGSITLTQETCV